LQILTTKLPAEERTNGAHHDYTTQFLHHAAHAFSTHYAAWRSGQAAS